MLRLKESFEPPSWLVDYEMNAGHFEIQITPAEEIYYVRIQFLIIKLNIASAFVMKHREVITSPDKYMFYKELGLNMRSL